MLSYSPNGPTTPQPAFGYYVNPYTSPFTDGGYYLNQSDNVGTYLLNQELMSSSNIFVAVYAGVPGNATLEDVDYGPAPPVSIVNSAPNDWSGTQGESFFAVAMGYTDFSEVLSENAFFTQGGTAVDPYFIVHWFWGSAPQDAAPTIASIAASPSSAELGPGSKVTLTISFDKAVSVTGGAPALALNDGGTAGYDASATAALNDPTKLVFDYTVGSFGSGQNTPDLALAASNAFLLNGATIADSSGTEADLSAANGYSPDGTLAINTTDPIVTVVSAIGPGGAHDVNAGKKVTITLTLDEAVKLKIGAFGYPTLSLNDGRKATYDAALSKPAAGKLVFDYIVQPKDNVGDLEVTSATIPVGTIVKDSGDHSIDFTNAYNVSTGLTVDTTAPRVTEITSAPNSGSLGLGDTAMITIAMSEAVTVSGPVLPILHLSDGAVATFDKAKSNTQNGTLIFDYTVGSSDKPTGDLKLTGISNENSIRDLAGNALSAAITKDLGLLVEPPVNLSGRNGGNLVIEMALLANEAYTDSTAEAVSRNWDALTAADLNLPASNKYTFNNGVYSASIAFGSANALVLEGNVNGQKTLAISFQGTNLSSDPGQVLDWPDFPAYYSNFLPLLQALGSYVQAHGIQRVLATGHSLGGAMVQDFMASVVEGKIRGITTSIISGYTWGSPGADQHPTIPRLVNFEGISDPVPIDASLLYRLTGTEISINSPSLGSPASTAFPVAHQMLNYLFDTEDLVKRASDQSSVFFKTADASALRSGNFSNATSLQVMPGEDSSDTVTISPADQYVLGGPGNNNFEWAPLSPVQNAAASTTIVEGGTGIDTLSLPGFQFEWSWKAAGAETDLYYNLSFGHPLIARLFNVEYLHFDLSPNSMVPLDRSPNTASVNANLSLLGQSIASFTPADSAAAESGSVLQNQMADVSVVTASALHHP